MTDNTGHNSGEGFSTVQVAADQLRSVVERIERLAEEKREAAEAMKEVYAEAKSTGFDVKTLKAIVKLRGMDPDQLSEQRAMLELYQSALGMPIE